MRLDVFLKRVGLIKQRSLAKTTCDGGHVTVGGRKAKPGKEVGVGDIIAAQLPVEQIEIEITGLPRRNCRRKQGEAFYKVIKYEKEDF